MQPAPAFRDPIVGGGATMAARRPEQLVVFAPVLGEYPTPLSAGVMKELRKIGYGDPYQFAAPNAPVPEAALSFWESTIAAAGQVVDGTAMFGLAEDGTATMFVTPAAGGGDLALRVEGIPIIGTGPTASVLEATKRTGKRHGAFPPAIDPTILRAEMRRPGSVKVALLIDDSNYLGYRVTITTGTGIARAFDVTGSASRFVPRERLTPAEIAQLDANDAREAPPEMGFDPWGIVPSAVQASQYGRWRRSLERR